MSFSTDKIKWIDVIDSHRNTIKHYSFEGAVKDLSDKVAKAQAILFNAHATLEGLQSGTYPLSFEERGAIMRSMLLLQGEMVGFTSAVKIHSWIVKMNSSISLLSAAKRLLDTKPSLLATHRSLTVYQRAHAVAAAYIADPELSADPRLKVWQTMLSLRLNEVFLRLQPHN